MNYWTRSRLVAGCVGAILALFALVSRVSAAGPGIPTVLMIQPVGPVSVGRVISIKVRLTTEPGTGIPGMAIQVFVNGGAPRQFQTDASGTVLFSVRDLSIGTNRVVAVYNGVPGYRPASTSIDIIATGANSTQVTLSPLGSIPMGKDIRITARLSYGTGGPIPDEGLDLEINGEHAASVQTDHQGLAALRVNQVLAVGTYRVLVVYRGSAKNAPASATMQLEIRRPEVELHTIPALEGVRFSANGHEFVSDKDGVARLPVDEPGVYHIEVLPFEPKANEMRVEFGRWEDDVFTPYHDVTVPSNGSPFEVGFNVSYKVGWTFVDLETHRVDPKRVTSITLKGSDGAAYTFPSDQTQWLPALHVIRRLTGLEVSALQYSVMEVTLNGTNVVSEMQQRFYAQPNDSWQVQLLLFSAHFTARDSVFGFPLGKSLRLEYPDRFVQDVPLDEKGQATVVSLPRGLYKVNVEQVPGISPMAPLAMSRDQEVVLLVISYLDLMVGALIGLVFGPGLLLIGRPSIRTALWNGVRYGPAEVADSVRRVFAFRGRKQPE